MKNNNHIPFYKLIPSIATVLAICVSLSAIKAAIGGHWEKATLFIFFAAILDGVDGRLARMLGAESKMGAELDSLADFINFGFVPIFVLYLWINQFNDVKFFDWGMVLLFSISMAIRLARFNTMTKSSEVANNSIEEYFFKGIPAPCSALVVLLPMMFSYEFGNETIVTKVSFVIFYACIISILTSSNVPTISIKKIPINKKYIYLIMTALLLVMIFLVTKIWLTLIVVGLLYFISIPFTAYSYFSLKNRK
jgi:CDP-diacylglycerol--serine O-phosphatidyltransferase